LPYVRREYLSRSDNQAERLVATEVTAIERGKDAARFLGSMLGDRARGRRENRAQGDRRGAGVPEHRDYPPGRRGSRRLLVHQDAERASRKTSAQLRRGSPAGRRH
jgi:hypothetical protein